MKFDELNTEFVGLRNMLRTFVSEDALEKITVQPPAGEDEASFLRLTAWSYAVIFESGRITIPYLLKLLSSSNRSQADAARQVVNDLRTSSFHNLGLPSDRNDAIYRRTSLWFMENCGANPPDGAVCWRICFERLCDEVGAVLAHCKSALELALSDAEDAEDREGIAEGLRQRLNRNWAAHRFDRLVSDSATRIGQNPDVRKFRQARLSNWRGFLETIPEGDDPEDQVARLIERDVLSHFESVLPIDGRDVMDVLKLDPGPEVGEALKLARRLYSSGVTNREELLERLGVEYRPVSADAGENG